MTLVRTHYLDWMSDAGHQIVRDMYFDQAPAQARKGWDAGLYVAGPWENDVPRTTDHLAICEFLFAKYNAGDRPDGRIRRSMSVGDIVQIGGSFYVCASFGFEPLDVKERVL